MIVPRSNSNASGYRISVYDYGEHVFFGRKRVKRQLRWLVTIRRNGSILFEMKCKDNEESYGRAVLCCFQRAVTCRRLGMYCRRQVEIELARRAYVASKALADTKLIAGG